MQNVSNDFKNQLTQPKTIDAKILVGNDTITSDDINNISRSFNSSLFKTITKTVNIDSNVPIEKNIEIEPQFGVYINNGFEYVHLGTYKTKDEPTLNKDTNSYQTIAYDKIVDSMVDYALTDTEITFPCTVRDLFVAIFNKLEWDTSGIPETFVNSSSIIQEDVYSRANMTYRDVLDELCTISCNFLIDKDNPILVDKNLLATITEETGTNIHIDDAQNEQISNLSLKGDTQQNTTMLPSEYQQVEYIASNGSQYINTGYMKNSTTRVVIDVQCNNTGTWIYGSRNNGGSTDSFGLYTNSGSVFWAQIGGSGTDNGGTFDGTTANRNVIDISGTEIKLNGTSMKTYTNTLTTGTNPFYLFGLNSAGSLDNRKLNGKIYYCKIYEGNSLVRNFVPCYRISDNVIGLYDTVNNVFYTNAGTGTFTKGNNVTLPTPDYPQDIKVVTGGQKIKIFNKNILTNSSLTQEPTNEDNWAMGTMNNVTSGSYSENGLTVTTPASGVSNNGRTITIKNANKHIPVGTRVTFSIDITGSAVYGHIKGFYKGYSQYWYSNNVVIVADTSTTSNDTIRYTGTFIMPDVGTDDPRLFIDLGQGNTQITTRTYKNALLEYGEESTPYEEHQEQTYPINLGDIELCKIGDYQDYIYKENDNWYLHKEIGKVVLNGTETPSSVSASTNTTRASYNHYADGSASNQLYCNMLTYQTNWSSDIEGLCYDTSNGGFWFRINKSTIGTTSDSVKTWLASHNLICYIPLATPTNTIITDTELIEQLESISKIETFKGANNITVSSSNLASPITIGYVSDVETINEEYMSDTSVEIRNQVFFNSLVFSRASDSDNIFRKDDDSIDANGLHEFKVRDLQILSLNWRDNFIDEMWNYIKKFKYYAYDVNTVGLSYLEPIDGFYLSTFGETYPTILLNSDLAIGNGVNEKIYANEPVESATEYKYADTTDRKINQAYLIVDKQNVQIQALTQTTSNIASEEQTHYQEMLSKMDDKASISDIETITNQVNVLQTDTYTKTEINKILNGTDENGNVVSFLQTLSATLDENGMSYNKTGANTSSNINETGVTVTNKKNNSELLFAGYDEEKLEALVRVANLYLTRFLGLDVWRIEIINDSTNGKGLGFFYIG